MSDTRQEQIAALEDYLRRYPSGHFTEIAQARLDRLLALGGEKKIAIVNSAANPFTAGTIAQRTDFRIGDWYAYQRLDMYTGNVLGMFKKVVTEITDLAVIYNRGMEVTDFLGNLSVRPNGQRFAGKQDFPLEYALSKRWETRYESSNEGREGNRPQMHGRRQGGPVAGGAQDLHNEVQFDFKVVAREEVTVPAGRFTAFRVEGEGYEVNQGKIRRIKYWVAPERVRRFLAWEFEKHFPKGAPERERIELTGFFEAA